VLYGGLMLFVLGLALLVVPALAAQSVNGDRECAATLAVLQVTRLSAATSRRQAVGCLGHRLVFLALTRASFSGWRTR
jgi:hypothetical protein